MRTSLSIWASPIDAAAGVATLADLSHAVTARSNSAPTTHDARFCPHLHQGDMLPSFQGSRGYGPRCVTHKRTRRITVEFRTFQATSTRLSMAKPPCAAAVTRLLTVPRNPRIENVLDRVFGRLHIGELTNRASRV